MSDRRAWNRPRGFRRSHAQVPPGTYSDDGAHQLALIASRLPLCAPPTSGC